MRTRGSGCSIYIVGRSLFIRFHPPPPKKKVKKNICMILFCVYELSNTQFHVHGLELDSILNRCEIYAKLSKDGFNLALSEYVVLCHNLCGIVRRF